LFVFYDFLTIFLSHFFVMASGVSLFLFSPKSAANVQALFFGKTCCKKQSDGQQILKKCMQNETGCA